MSILIGNGASPEITNLIQAFKEKSLQCFGNVNILQFVRGPREVLRVDVSKIFVDLECEQFVFHTGYSSGDGSKESACSCLEKLAYKFEKENYIILGLPGAGKSTLLKRLFKDYWECPKVIPIYVELKQEETRGGFSALWSRKDEATDDDLACYLSKYLNRFSFPIRKNDACEIYKELVKDGYEFVFFCDGLDEISKENYTSFAATVNMLAEWNHIRFVISSRQVGFSRKDYSSEVFTFVSLLDFTIEKQVLFIEKYFSIVEEERRGLITQDALYSQRDQLKSLLEKPFIQRMAKSPILLSLLCVTPNLEGIKNKSGLFENAIKILLYNRHIDEEREQAIVIGFLKTVAVEFFKLDKAESFKLEELEFYANRFFHDKNITAKPIQEYLNCGLFDKIELGDDKTYKFAHRTIWEYLVALGMVDRDKNEIYDRAGMLIWAEPIKMWGTLVSTRQIVDKAEIFKDLWKRNKALCLTCMNEFSPFPKQEFNELYNGLSKRDKLRLIATLWDSYVNPSSDYRKQAVNTICETLSIIHNVERDCEVVYAYLEFLEKFRDETHFGQLLHDFLDYDHLPSRLEKMQECGLEFIDIPAGAFAMGRNPIQCSEEEKKYHINVDAEEMPAHNVRITKPFKISKTLITNKMFYDSGFPYVSCTDQGSPLFEGNVYSATENQPVNYVNWFEAVVFAKWLGCTLPTEAEWEYACRGETHGDYMQNNLLELIAELDCSCCYASRNVGHPNKTRPVFNEDHRCENSYGLVDMLGNLREWCLDWYSDDFYIKCRVETYENFKNDIMGKQYVSYVHDASGCVFLAEEGRPYKEDIFTFDAAGYCLDPMKKVPGKFEAKCLRGGCFDWNESNLRPTYRNHNPANNVYKVNGFRIVQK